MQVQYDQTIDSKLTVAVFASVMAITLGLTYYLARVGFEQYTLLIMHTIALSLLFVCAPAAYLLVAQRLGRTQGSTWISADVVVRIVVIAIVALFGRAAPPFQQYVLPVFSATGLLCCVIVIWSWSRTGQPWRNALFLTFTIIFAVWLAAEWIAFGFQTPLFEENMLLGRANIDILFHTSISSIIQVYGIPSTGLDGVPYLPYHTGSHWLFAQFSTFLGTYPLRFYQLVVPIILCPLFFSSLVSFAVDVRRIIIRSVPHHSLRNNLVVWSLVVIAHVGVIPLELRHSAGIYNSHLVSESYVTALIWMFFSFSLVLAFWSTARHRLDKLSHYDKVFLLLMVPVMLGVMGFLKISVMVLVFVVSLLIFVRITLYKQSFFVVSISLAALSCLFVYRLVAYPYESINIVLFHYIKTYISKSVWPFFGVLYFFLVWLFIFYRLRQLAIVDIAMLIEAVKQRKLLDVEILVVVCVVGIAPGLVLAIPGGSADYFSDIQRWVALAFLLAYADVLVYGWSVPGLPRVWWTIGTFKLSWLLILGVGCILTLSLLIDVIGTVRSAYGWNMQTRATLLGRDAPSLTGAVKRRDFSDFYYFFTAPYEYFIQQQPTYQMIHTLHNLRTLPVSERKNSLLFIPHATSDYWNLLVPGPSWVCFSVSLFAPAVTGMAMIDGARSPQPDCGTDTYGFAIYHNINSRDSAVTSIAELCQQVQELGFSQLMIIKGGGAELHVERHACVGIAADERASQ